MRGYSADIGSAPATAQALGQFAQRRDIGLGQRAGGQLLAQLLQSLAGS